SEPIDPATVKSGWSGTATTVPATFTNAGGNDTFTIGGTNLGAINTTANYVMGTGTCAGSSRVGGARTRTGPPGACTGATRTGPPKGTAFFWPPSAAITDLAGNPISTALVSGSQGGF